MDIIWDIRNCFFNNRHKKFVDSQKIKFQIFGKPTRLILINSKTGPSISDILFILGKKDSIKRITNYIDII